MAHVALKCPKMTSQYFVWLSELPLAMRLSPWVSQSYSINILFLVKSRLIWAYLGVAFVVVYHILGIGLERLIALAAGHGDAGVVTISWDVLWCK